jgi:hypothetical protein
MAALGVKQISVWLEERNPEQGAFAYGLEWAARLRLPLQVFASTEPVVAALPANGSNASGSSLSDTLRTCRSACDRKGVAWGAFLWHGDDPIGLEHFFHPSNLSVLGEMAATPRRRELIAAAAHNNATPVLICPPSWQPMSRVLIVHHQHDHGSPFLDTVVGLCQQLAVAPVVLTMASSERQALAEQAIVETKLAQYHLSGDLDYMVGCDVATAVSVVARWRHCSHVFVERPRAAAWWGWLRPDPLEQLLRTSSLVSTLVLPASRQRASPSDMNLPVVTNTTPQEAKTEKLSTS